MGSARRPGRVLPRMMAMSIMGYSPFIEATRRIARRSSKRGTASMLVRQSSIIRMGWSEKPTDEGCGCTSACEPVGRQPLAWGITLH